MASGINHEIDGAGRSGSAVRPAWLKSRPATGVGEDSPSVPPAASQPPPLPAATANGLPAKFAAAGPGAARTGLPNLPQVNVPAMPAVEAVKSKRVWPRTLGGWLAFLWTAVIDWWSGLYLGWGVTTSLSLHALVALVLAFTFFTMEQNRGMLVNGAFDEASDGEEFENILDSRLDTSFGDKAATLEFVASDVTSDLTAMASPDNILGGADGDGEKAGEEAAAMAKNIRVPESAVTRGSFTVWTEPEDPTPRIPYDIIIQVKLPNAAKHYRLSDLSGTVRGTDGYLKQIKYLSTERKGVKDGVVQISIRIPGAAQLVKDVIQIRSKLLKEEQTLEIIFGQPS